MKIFPKLFIAFAASFLAVIALMVVTLDWSFEQGFLKYIHESEVKELELFASELEDYYGEVQTWEFIRVNPRIADVLLNERRLFDQNIIVTARETGPGKIYRRYRFSFSPPSRDNKLNQRNFQRFGEGITSRLGISELRQGINQGRLTLLDENGEVVLGIKDLPKNTMKVTIKHRDKEVGTLVLLPNPDLSEQIDLQFAEAQQSTLYISALVALFVAAIISLIFTLNFTGPIRKLATATKELIGGEFKTRVDIKNKDEIGKLSRHFNILAKTLDKNSASQKQWIADISHELRTPLAILKSEIEAIQDGIRNFDKETLKSLSNEVTRLNSLVDDLYELALSDIGAMKYQMIDLDLKDVLKETLDGYKERFQQSGIELTTDIGESISIVGDRQRLSQLFTNLLENSLRYTDSPGTLAISTSNEEDHVVVVVSDSAPGIDPESIDKIFDRFYREELSRSREKGGAGIGLSICAAIVEAHSGSISAQASNLGGLLIEVKLNKNQ
jgi:two-component system sensor histidine kinase BaeS